MIKHKCKSLSHVQLCDPMDFTVYGILQARILEWAANSFSRKSSHIGIEPGSPALQADSLPTINYDKKMPNNQSKILLKSLCVF